MSKINQFNRKDRLLLCSYITEYGISFESVVLLARVHYKYAYVHILRFTYIMCTIKASLCVGLVFGTLLPALWRRSIGTTHHAGVSQCVSGECLQYIGMWLCLNAVVAEVAGWLDSMCTSPRCGSGSPSASPRSARPARGSRTSW